MTAQLEKVFFNWIKQNRKYYNVVHPYFFKNKEIKFIYEILRNYMLESSDVETPSARQLYDMIALEDHDSHITKDIFRTILKIDLNEYDEEKFIVPKFNSWVLSNRLRGGSVDIIEETRNLENVSDFDSTKDIAMKIREIVDDMTSVQFIKSDDDLGSDFDDPEAHSQDLSALKIKSGFESLDHMLGGGWDVSTLNILMCSTGNGKCAFSETIINTRVKGESEEKTQKMGRLFTIISKGSYDN